MGRGGVAIYENPGGFPVSKPGVSRSLEDKKKLIDIKNLGGHPLVCVCAVCAMDMSHLSRHMSRLSRGHSAP